MTFTHALSTDNYGPAKFIVDASAANGTHTTIASALTSASSGDTIFIRPGTYTEDLTLKAGVNLVAYDGDQTTPNVTIVGKATATFAGSCSISGIRLQTNSDNFLVVSGASATSVTLLYCYLNCTNNTGISYTSSSGSSNITCYDCTGDIGTTGIAFAASTSAGTLGFRECNFINSGLSTTSMTASSGNLFIVNTNINSPITTSGTAFLSIQYSNFASGDGLNTCAVTVGGTDGEILQCVLNGGTATALTVTSTTTLYGNTILSSNANPITGAGTIRYCGNTFNNSTGNTGNITTQTSRTFHGGYLRSLPSNTQTQSGCIGETANSTASDVLMTDSTPKTITSISLTAGVWLVSGMLTTNPSVGITAGIASISTTNNTLTGANGISQAVTAITNTFLSLSVPSYLVTPSSTTTYYLVGQANFSSGTCTISGRITAVRIC